MYGRDELETIGKLNLENIDKVFILHDLYSMELKDAAKEAVKIMIKNVSQNDEVTKE